MCWAMSASANLRRFRFSRNGHPGGSCRLPTEREALTQPGPPTTLVFIVPGHSARLTSASVRSCCLSTSRVSQHTTSREETDGNRNREVVQRRQGLRVHHARRSG